MQIFHRVLNINRHITLRIAGLRGVFQYGIKGLFLREIKYDIIEK
jgi:hypothetical protein